MSTSTNSASTTEEISTISYEMVLLGCSLCSNEWRLHVFIRQPCVEAGARLVGEHCLYLRNEWTTSPATPWRIQGYQRFGRDPDSNHDDEGATPPVGKRVQLKAAAVSISSSPIAEAAAASSGNRYDFRGRNCTLTMRCVAVPHSTSKSLRQALSACLIRERHAT